MAEGAFWFKSQGIKKLNLSPKRSRPVKILAIKSLIIVDSK